MVSSFKIHVSSSKSQVTQKARKAQKILVQAAAPLRTRMTRMTRMAGLTTKKSESKLFKVTPCGVTDSEEDGTPTVVFL